VNRAVPAEFLGDLILGRAEGQVAHVQFLQGLFSRCQRYSISGWRQKTGIRKPLPFKRVMPRIFALGILRFE